MTEDKANQSPAEVSQLPNPRKQSVVSEIAWFTMGLILGLCLSLAIAWVGSFFRGPISGYNPMLFPIFAKDQFFVDLGTGFALVTIGWLTVYTLKRMASPRGTIWGVIVVTTSLGIAFACGM